MRFFRARTTSCWVGAPDFPEAPGPFEVRAIWRQVAVRELCRTSRTGELFLQQQLVVPCENKPVDLTIMFNQDLLLSSKQ